MQLQQDGGKMNLTNHHPRKVAVIMDLNHAVPMHSPTRIWTGGYENCTGAAITVITAGSAQKPGETRLDLIQRNAVIFRSIVENVVKHNPDGIILVATNPVDVLTYATWKFSGLPSNRVIGSGTILDTARFRYLLSQKFEVDPRSVHAYIIGEHGDSEVPVWSLANIAGMRLPEYCSANDMGCRQDQLDSIFKQTRDAGGVERTIRLDLNEEEIAGIRRSATVLKETIATIEF
jgi:L-lactate dehydrogenase